MTDRPGLPEPPRKGAEGKPPQYIGYDRAMNAYVLMWGETRWIAVGFDPTSMDPDDFVRPVVRHLVDNYKGLIVLHRPAGEAQ